MTCVSRRMGHNGMWRRDPSQSVLWQLPRATHAAFAAAAAFALAAAPAFAFAFACAASLLAVAATAAACAAAAFAAAAAAEAADFAFASVTDHFGKGGAIFARGGGRDRGDAER